MKNLDFSIKTDWTFNGKNWVYNCSCGKTLYRSHKLDPIKHVGTFNTQVNSHLSTHKLS